MPPAANPGPTDPAPKASAPSSSEELLQRLERLEAEMQAVRMAALSQRMFELGGKSYLYHVAPGNKTWDN